MNEEILFTKLLTEIFSDAVKIAMKEDHLSGSEHFLLAYTRNEQTGDILRRVGVTSMLVAEAFQVTPRVDTKSASLTKGEKPSLSVDGMKATSNSVDLARKLNQSVNREKVFVNTNLFLLSLIRNKDTNAYRILETMKVPLDRLEELISISMDSLASTPEGEHPELVAMTERDDRASIINPNKNKRGRGREFITNYTELAAEGKLDPVIGREEEVERCLQILARRSKNNPVLVGEPGVGKTAVVEGIAQHLLNPNNDVPASLRNRDVWSVDIASMVAGSKYRGEFEERLKTLMTQAVQQNAILFIDEIHTILSAGNGEGAVSAGNILKPELARGKLQTIGATTHDEYRKYFEKDAALARRFHQVPLDEPSKDETFEILKGLQNSYELHHNVHYPDETLRAAINMSVRYMSDRFLPDKAIDLIDESGSRAKFMKRDITEKKSALKANIRELRELADRQITPEGRQTTLAEVRELEDELIQLNLSVANQGTIEIVPEDIATVITKITGIPVSVNSEDNTRYRNMEKIIQERVIGQQNAIKALSKTIRRQRSGLKDPKRPSGSFIFAGPTGVGKTELVKSLAEFMFGDDTALIALDMSEYGEKHTVSRLFGAPPGYVGFEEGGQLTEKVRRKPYSIILFDEIEKAHPDVFNSLLQILEEGRLTDGQGRMVDFRNTVIVMTTNVGAEQLNSTVGFHTGTTENTYKHMKTKVMGEMKKKFKPEFLNRLDDIIVFPHLEQDELEQIVDILIANLNKRAEDAGYVIEVTPEGKTALVQEDYDHKMGARPLRRAIQSVIEDTLSEMIIAEKVTAGTITIGHNGEEFTFNGEAQSDILNSLNEEAVILS